jgi:hypothetical protein
MKWYNLIFIFFCIVLIFQVASLKLEKNKRGTGGLTNFTASPSAAKAIPPAPCMSVKMDRNLDQHFVDSCTAYDKICGDTATLNVVINLPEGQEDSYMDSYTRAVTIKSSDCGKLLYNFA